MVQQILVRIIERRLADAVANPGFRHVEHHVFVVGALLHALVAIALRLVGAGIVVAAALAPRPVERFTVFVGFHAVDVGRTLQDVAAACRIGVPRQVGGLVKLPVLSHEAVGVRHYLEDVVFTITLLVFPIVVAAIAQSVGSRYEHVNPLGVACLGGDGDVVALGFALLTCQRVEGLHAGVVLLAVGELHDVSSFMYMHLIELVIHIFGQRGHRKLDFVGAVALHGIFARVEMRQPHGVTQRGCT